LLNLDRDRDVRATLALLDLIQERQADTQGARAALEDLIDSRTSFVFGCGTSLDTQIDGLLPDLAGSDIPLIAADGAASALMHRGIRPHIVVTDLDGNPSDICRASHEGSILVLHCHGDNISEVRRWFPRLSNVVPVTQTEPTSAVSNYGGFTDGDKCIFIAVHFRAARIILSGMDFGTLIGRWSLYRPRDPQSLDLKRKKLEIARELTSHIIRVSGIPVSSLPPRCLTFLQETTYDEARDLLRGD